MARWANLACAGALLWCGCSPYGGGAFHCDDDLQCGPGGRCTGGFCSFPDPACDSGFRYGELSGPQSGVCVGAEPTLDAGDVDALVGHCYGTGLVIACFDAVPSGTQMLGGNMVLNTDSDPRCAATTNNVPACVIAAESIAVGGFQAVTGQRPLVLVATQTISVENTLTASSSRQFNFAGAGVDLPGCSTGTAPTGSSGGAGGSFGGTGGNGASAGLTGSSGTAGTGGIAGAVLAPTTLRGGCSGQDGADAVAPIGPGTKGRGGGALYLIADASITIAGTLSANGAGATGGRAGDSGGGGGGGSGGFIGLDTPSLTITGNVLANGGGGGEGSSTQNPGSPGQDTSSATNAASGGAGGTSFGTDGGDGSVGAQKDGEAGAAQCTNTCSTPLSGGGGGGGAGIIKLYRATSATGDGGISPVPS